MRSIKCKYCGKENHLSEETVCDSSPGFIVGHDLYLKDAPQSQSAVTISLKDINLSSELSDKIIEADELRERVRLLDAENKFLSSKIRRVSYETNKENNTLDSKERRLLNQCLSTIKYINTEAKRGSAVYTRTQVIIDKIKKERL